MQPSGLLLVLMVYDEGGVRLESQNLKYRHEFKYTVNTPQIILLENRIKHIMDPDANAGDTGVYNIRSLYFDDYYDRCFKENENGTDPREKFRIRIYNASSEKITLECKRKEKGKTLKTFCPLTLQQAQKLIRGIPLDNISSQHPVLRKLTLEMLTKRMKPVVIVSYDRKPFVCKDGNVRVTLDMNISSSSAVETFLNKKIPHRLIMPSGQHLLEVKFDEYLPDYIYQGLQLNSLRQTTFSKYYMCRKYRW